MGLTDRIIAHFCATGFEDIPRNVVEVQKQALIDAVAVSLAAVTLGNGCGAFISLADEQADRRECTVIGSGVRSSLLLAAMANGALAHAVDFEDVHDASSMHSNAVPTAAALTVAEMRGGVSGRQFLAAMALGSDLAIRMALAMNKDAISKGWYMPPVHGGMGAAMTVGKIMGFSPGQYADALALAMNQITCSAELVNSSKSVVRSVRDAFAAKGAVVACLLAEKGISARFEEPLEGKLGYYTAFAHGDYNPEKILNGLGTRYESGEISFKPWPSCRGTHPYIEMILRVLSENNLSHEEIESVHAVVSELNEMLFHPRDTKYRPTSAINAKFSIPYTASIAAVFGTVALGHFCEEYYTDARITRLADRFTYEVDHALEKTQCLYGSVVVRARGREFRENINIPKGNKQNPMTEAEKRQKFMSCGSHAAMGFSPARLEAIYEKLSNVEAVSDMREIMTLL
jgi:2-methylcitrate dehydratase PrpD